LPPAWISYQLRTTSTCYVLFYTDVLPFIASTYCSSLEATVQCVALVAHFNGVSFDTTSSIVQAMNRDLHLFVFQLQCLSLHPQCEAAVIYVFLFY